MAHRPYNNLQRREFRAMATLPTHIEYITIAGPGIDLSINPSAYDQIWETDRLCIVKLNQRSGVGGLPTTGDDRNLQGFDLRLWGVNTPENFFNETSDPRSVPRKTVLDANRPITIGSWLLDQDFPLWIRKIQYKTQNRAVVFDVYYFDL